MKKLFVSMLAVILLIGTMLPVQSVTADTSDLNDLVAGISEVVSPGVPGPVQAEVADWVPIVAGDENAACAGDTSGPKTFVMARTYGAGRVVIMGHDGLIGSLSLLDNKQFVLNIISWLDDNDGKRVMFSTGHSEWVTASTLNPLKTELQSRGYSFEAAAAPISSSFLAGRDVLIFGNAWGTISPSEIDAVENFVANGGGLFLIGLGWSWGHYHPTPIEEYPMMKLAVPYEVRWLECYLWDVYYDQTPIFNVFYPNISTSGIEVIPSTWDFGVLVVGDTVEMQIVIYNPDIQNTYTITEINTPDYIELDANCFLWWCFGLPPEDLSPSESKIYTFKLNSDDQAGKIEDTIEIKFKPKQGGDEQTLYVPVRGTVISDPSVLMNYSAVAEELSKVFVTGAAYEDAIENAIAAIQDAYDAMVARATQDYLGILSNIKSYTENMKSALISMQWGVTLEWAKQIRNFSSSRYVSGFNSISAKLIETATNIENAQGTSNPQEVNAYLEQASDNFEVASMEASRLHKYYNIKNPDLTLGTNDRGALKGPYSGIYDFVDSLGNTIDKFASLLKKEEPFVIIANSPVDLIIEGPSGNITSKYVDEIYGSTYLETDLDSDNEKEDLVFIYPKQAGSYTVTPIREDGASLEDTYSIGLLLGDEQNVVVEDQLIEDIPEQGFKLFLNDLPVADAGGPYQVDEGTEVIFNGSASYDPDGSIESYSWNFGDSHSDTGLLTTHAYGDDGLYITALTVTDNDGGVGADSCFIAVQNVGPILGDIIVPQYPVAVNTSIDFTCSFMDPGFLDTHEAIWWWGSGSPSPGIIDASGGLGTVSGNKTYDMPGVYTIYLFVADDDYGLGMAIHQYIVIYDPEGGFVTGGGWIYSKAGNYLPDPTLEGKATFGFVSKYKKGATTPTGQTQFQFKCADLNFHSDSYDWLVIAGHKAMYKGEGTINGAGNYGFMLSAVDAALTPSTDTDLFRIKIWDKDNADTIVYDNQHGDDDYTDLTTAIGGGSIVIHKAK